MDPTFDEANGPAVFNRAELTLPSSMASGVLVFIIIFTNVTRADVVCSQETAKSASTQACEIECKAAHCETSENNGRHCTESCSQKSGTRLTGEIIFGCAKGLAWDLPIATITTPIAIMNAIFQSAGAGATFAEWCEKNPPSACKNKLARDAAYMVHGHIGADAELTDVYTQDLIRKRGQVRAMAARDPNYRSWLIKQGFDPDSMAASTTAADLLFNYAVTSLGHRWTCANGQERAALICETLASILLGAKGLAPIKSSSVLGQKIAGAQKLYSRGQTELNRVSELSQAEKAHLKAAHEMGDARVGQYSRPEIMAKYRELRKAYNAEDAKRLLKRGVAGNVSDDSLAIAERLEAITSAIEANIPKDEAGLAANLEAYRDVAQNPEARALIEPSAQAMSVSHNLKILRTMPPDSLASAKQVGGGLKITKDEVAQKSGKYYIFYHGTSEVAARAIAKGVDLNAGNGEFGNGFYLTSSRTQAQNWAEATSGTRNEFTGRPTVLTYVFRRAELEKLVDEQSQLALEKGSQMFERFVMLNQKIRKVKDRKIDNPSNEIGTLYGPSISQAKSVFNQIKFSPTKLNEQFFSPDNPAVAVFVDQ